MDVVNRIMTYLKSSSGKVILISKHEHLDIMSHVDSDFTSFKVSKKSTSEYLTFVRDNLVT